MRFPNSHKLALPVVFERYVPGRQHSDGRRYLPQLILRAPGGALLGVVDRHHYVDAGAAGQHGTARLVFLLGAVALQRGDARFGIDTTTPEQVTTMPTIYGRVLELPSWELRRGELPYEELFFELLLDIGEGVVGVRSTVTAADIAQRLGASRIQPGDLLGVHRSRIDILGFQK